MDNKHDIVELTGAEIAAVAGAGTPVREGSTGILGRAGTPVREGSTGILGRAGTPVREGSTGILG